MNNIKLCPPALIYVIFSLTQIIIDTYLQLYSTAFVKIIIMIIFTILLNLLCAQGMSVISWIIVMIPFIFMSVIVAAVLFLFGTEPQEIEEPSNIKTGNLIYSSGPEPVTTTDYVVATNLPPTGSSDPQFT